MTATLPPLALGLMLSPLLMLAGCGQSSVPKAGGTASGDVLPGTVSDAMLNTDRSQAQAPLAPAVHSTGTKAEAGAGADASEAAPDTEAAAETPPVAEASAQPKPATPMPPKPKPAASPKPTAP
jgi:hypothetical protein